MFSLSLSFFLLSFEGVINLSKSIHHQKSPNNFFSSTGSPPFCSCSHPSYIHFHPAHLLCPISFPPNSFPRRKIPYVGDLAAGNRSSKAVLGIVKLVPDLTHVRSKLCPELVQDRSRDQQACKDRCWARHSFWVDLVYRKKERESCERRDVMVRACSFLLQMFVGLSLLVLWTSTILLRPKGQHIQHTESARDRKSHPQRCVPESEFITCNSTFIVRWITGEGSKNTLTPPSLFSPFFTSLLYSHAHTLVVASQQCDAFISRLRIIK